MTREYNAIVVDGRTASAVNLPTAATIFPFFCICHIFSFREVAFAIGRPANLVFLPLYFSSRQRAAKCCRTQFLLFLSFLFVYLFV